MISEKVVGSASEPPQSLAAVHNPVEATGQFGSK